MSAAQLGAVFFDAVGTLLFPEPEAARVYHDVGERFGSRLTLDEIRRRFRTHFQAEEAWDHAHDLRTDEARERRRWYTIVTRTLDDVNDPEACFSALYEHFARPEAWRVDPNAGRIIDDLLERDLRVGLASNLDHRLHAVLAGHPTLQKLSPVIMSAEIGWRKPSRAFFEAVCASVALPPSAVLMVGDDRVNDEEGALAAGMQALHISRLRLSAIVAPRER